MSTPEGVTREDFDALMAELADVKKAQLELQKASTPKERSAAREDVDDAERDFRRLARRYGLDDDDITSAIKSKRKRELRELLGEIQAEDGETPADESTDNDGDVPVADLRAAAAARKKGKKPKAPAEPEADEEPRVTVETAKTWASRIFS